MSPGRVITLIGGKGSGRTAVGRSLGTRLAVPVTFVYMGPDAASATHMLPTTRAWISLRRKLGRDASHYSDLRPRRTRSRPAGLSTRCVSHAVSLLHLAAHVPEDLYRLLVVGLARVRGHVVIADRHPVVDHFIVGTVQDHDGADWSRLGDDIYDQLRRRLYPRPETIIHLDAPAGTAPARRPEGAVETNDAVHTEHAVLKQAIRDAIRVDAARPLDEVVNEVVGIVERRRSQRPALDRRQRAVRRAARVRNRLYYRPLDAINTAEVRSSGPALGYLRRGLKLRSSNFDRLGCVSKSVAMAAPGLMGRACKALLETSRLPLRGQLTRPFDYGTAMTCYRVLAEPSCVLKISRDSIGQPTDRLVELARRWRANYETLLRWYADVPGLIPPTTYVVMHGPLRGASAVGKLQIRVQGDISDLLRDHDDKQLESMLQRDSRFRALFVAFVHGARQAWEAEGRTIDLIGAKNLILYRAPEGLELRVVDLGIVDLNLRLRHNPRWCDEMLSILARMERLAQSSA